MRHALLPLVALVVFAGCKVKEDGLVILATAEDEALLRAGVEYMADERVKLKVVTDPAAELANRDGVVVAVTDSDACDECWVGALTRARGARLPLPAPALHEEARHLREHRGRRAGQGLQARPRQAARAAPAHAAPHRDALRHVARGARCRCSRPARRCSTRWGWRKRTSSSTTSDEHAWASHRPSAPADRAAAAVPGPGDLAPVAAGLGERGGRPEGPEEGLALARREQLSAWFLSRQADGGLVETGTGALAISEPR